MTTDTVIAGASSSEVVLALREGGSQTKHFISKMVPLNSGIKLEHIEAGWDRITIGESGRHYLLFTEQKISAMERSSEKIVVELTPPADDRAVDAMLSPDGRWLAAPLASGKIMFGDTETGAVRTLVFEGNEHILKAEYDVDFDRVQFTPDGSLYVSDWMLDSDHIEIYPETLDILEIPLASGQKFLGLEVSEDSIETFIGVGSIIHCSKMQIPEDAAAVSCGQFASYFVDTVQVQFNDARKLLFIQSVDRVDVWSRSPNKLEFSVSGENSFSAVAIDSEGSFFAIDDGVTVRVFETTNWMKVLEHPAKSAFTGGSSWSVPNRDIVPLHFSAEKSELWVGSPADGNILVYIDLPESSAARLKEMRHQMSSVDQQLIKAHGMLWWPISNY